MRALPAQNTSADYRTRRPTDQRGSTVLGGHVQAGKSVVRTPNTATRTSAQAVSVLLDLIGPSHGGTKHAELPIRCLSRAVPVGR